MSIASVSIPYGQRFITLKLARQDELVSVAPGNLFLRLTTEVFTSAGAGKGTPAAVALDSYSKYETFEPVVVSQSTVAAQEVESVDLYINNIFVNPEIHDIYIKRIGFSLIRVYRTQTFDVTVESGEQLLAGLKWPIETIFMGMRPKFNQKQPTRNGLSVTAGNVSEWRDWHRFTRNVDRVALLTSTSSGVMPIAADVTTLAPTNFLPTENAQKSVTQAGRLVFPDVRKTVTTLGIKAHGVDVYNNFKSEFFASYQPYTYGGYNINTPQDEGALMVNFCLHPGTYQPSGHMNVSRAREFYVTWTSGFTGLPDTSDPSSPAAAVAQFVCVAIAINFLLISDGSAVLRYST